MVVLFGSGNHGQEFLMIVTICFNMIVETMADWSQLMFDGGQWWFKNYWLTSLHTNPEQSYKWWLVIDWCLLHSWVRMINTGESWWIVSKWLVKVDNGLIVVRHDVIMVKLMANMMVGDGWSSGESYGNHGETKMICQTMWFIIMVDKSLAVTYKVRDIGQKWFRLLMLRTLTFMPCSFCIHEDPTTSTLKLFIIFTVDVYQSTKTSH